ncbi:putative nucleic-acid-binding protein [Beggiatoa alba B18LD]|uniref:Putative nucleic-acid-binding protein n=1 Tax=Beggiatoa alba B18LD TaxID=395493 RepID=I3CKJ0_9GAMM|nr:PIN domain-containing protein [Beggiatoa alba]EIJ44133.1 putative nucleic-acid-binding protein [Beggiatoa alba B18LD]
MQDKHFFIDTNILIYALARESDAFHKKQIAIDLLSQSPILSTQIINECSNVLRRKFNWTYYEIRETFEFVLTIATVINVSIATIQQAWSIGEKYSYSYFDSLVLASALESDCNILYSEDMQNGQTIENCLKIVNPFK